jgi:hypothetical protein
MKDIFYFGEEVKDYNVRVLNEREVRAGAGILFVLAMTAFFNAFLIGNYVYLKIFVILFLIDFVIRVFINPKFSPSLILGRFVVSKQKVEYAGAPQKKFAWGIGIALALTMFIIVVLLDITGPINFAICLVCLTVLFLETSFGICLGCTIYNWFNKEKAKLCPGGACELQIKQKIQQITPVQIVIVIAFVVFMILISRFFLVL